MSHNCFPKVDYFNNNTTTNLEKITSEYTCNALNPTPTLSTVYERLESYASELPLSQARHLATLNTSRYVTVIYLKMQVLNGE